MLQREARRCLEHILYQVIFVISTSVLFMLDRTRRYFLQIAYQGTHYHGWQVQPNATTVQGVIQARLAQLLGQDISIVGSSRTDTGVHAHQQFAHVDLAPTVAINRLHYQLNAVLPPDIAIVAMHPVRSQAHARFDALARTYEYTIVQSKAPFRQATSYCWHGTLDVAQMNEAAALLCRKQDFQQLCKVRSGDQHFLCDITAAGWLVQQDRLIFRIQANRFLRSMVRIIVSLMLKIGQGQLNLSTFEALIDQKETSLQVGLAPPQGLSLTAVSYPEDLFTDLTQ